MKISGPLFGGLVGGSLLLVGAFHVGSKRNLKLTTRLSHLLEDSLQPKDQNYTWLGGVMGFTGEYQVPGFKKVMVVYRLLPRQSLLWLPFHFLAGGRDTVQALFYLKGLPSQEFHLVRGGFLKRPKIYNKSLLKVEKKVLAGKAFRILYERDLSPLDRITGLLGEDLPLVRHVAVTKEKGVFYLEIPLVPSRLERGAALLGKLAREIKEEKL